VKEISPAPTKFLEIIYDGECELCRRSLRWMERQPASTELRFLPLQSPEVTARFPQLEGVDLRAQLTVITETGDIHRGAGASIMCLRALKNYRGLANRLADPILAPVADRLYGLMASNRLRLSRGFFKATSADLLELAAKSPVTCPVKGACNG